MDRVAIYCRLSDEDRNKANDFDDSESIQNQKNLLMKYAMDKGWSIYKIYSDDDYSGLDKDRPEFNQMIRDAEENKFNIILCKHQSRFTRDMELVEKYLHNKFIQWGIRFVTIVDGVDTFDKHNKKARQINGLINEWYCEDVSESIRAIFKMKQHQGKFIGSFAGYGFQKDFNDRNKLVIDEEAAKVIKQIFKWCLEGYGTQKIADMLNERETPNPTKYKNIKGYKYKNSSAKDNYGFWNKLTIKRILRNEMYIGNMVQHRCEKLSYKSPKMKSLESDSWIVVENTHEPIIDKKTFFMVQERLNNNIKSTGTGQSHIFAGKVKCMDCGSTMQKLSNGSGVSYLRCKLYSTNSKKKLCTSHSIRLDKLEDIVSERVKQYLKNLDEESITRKISEEMDFNEKVKALKKEFNKVKNDISDRDNTIKSLYIDKVKGLISDEQFTAFNESFINEKKSLEQKIKVLQEEISKLTDKSNRFEMIRGVVRKYLGFEKLTHIMVNELIDYIEIGEKNKETKEQRIKIHWLI